MALALPWGMGRSAAADDPAATPPYVKEWINPVTGNERRVTQEEREAAAERFKAAQRATQGAPSRAGRLMPMPMPGGTPHYFGPEPNWAFSPPLRKFVNTLPLLGSDNANDLGQFLAVANADTTTYPGCDYYEISLVQYAEQMHSDLGPTTLRGYVQTNNGTDPATGLNTIVPATVHYLGPIIVAQRNRPVRIKFTNALPTGTDGDLFIPVDPTVMGAGMGPVEMPGMPGMMEEYTQNRGTLHLHGGRTPWISDGTPHQWITPAGEMTSYPKGVSVTDVPDMPDPGDGSMTFFYSNQQSARLMFYHDHAWGITRLNVYVGEAAGYLITDPTDAALTASGAVPAEQIPLIIQDKTFVDANTIMTTDPTWAWGPMPGMPMTGDLWMAHVYMTAQNPYDISGVNPFGRWHYGPWFWPPTPVTYPPVVNPYYDPAMAPWEPPYIPGVPHPSMGMESFCDTPVINGTAFPTHTVQPKAYRLRILNAANDRFWNLQWYVADPTTISTDGRTLTEVKMLPAQTTAGFPESWPTDGREGGVPDPATAGPGWLQIGTEGGFLPAPAPIPNQPIAWNMDPTTFNFGNVSDHALLLGPAERADVIVDFSAFAGQTLILYNDAPAAFPALDPRYDYYTGAPDLTDTGGHSGPQVGFGPNTRTLMQIQVADATPVAFDPAPLDTALPAAFAASQDPIIVGQTAYNGTYNTTFPATWPNWGYVRIQDNSMSFKTVAGDILTLPLQPKAIQDEMGEAYDYDYGRMSGKLGLELPGTTALNQTFVLQGFVDPATEILSDSVTSGPPVAGDGTQIWKITHNGVDTHPIHFHLFDVQLINRVGWDGAIRLPDLNERGWKETVRVSPLEDTIVALRPVSPKQPFGIPDSVRPLDPSMPIGSPGMFTNIDPHTGDAIEPPITNQFVNFGWEYVWHCHILSHEEMDMMRPMSFWPARALAAAPVVSFSRVGGQVNLLWTDGTPVADPATWGNPANEVGYRIERAVVTGGIPGAYDPIGTALANATTFSDPAADSGTASWPTMPRGIPRRLRPWWP
jgi:FtsP/CotA-like multicopper oxidase with cupredoxin domain